MTTRNERTSKAVASKAGKLLARQNELERLFKRLQAALVKHAQLVRSVAGSALTQAADRRR